MSSGDAAGASFVLLITALLVAAAYFLPTIIALVRRARNRGSIFVVNLFFGWTLIGWVIALSMAVASRDRSKIRVVHHHHAPPAPPVPHEPAALGPAASQALAPVATAPAEPTSAGGTQARPGTPARPSRWAADPYGASWMRYHDGSVWTRHVAEEDGTMRSELADYPVHDRKKGWNRDPYERHEYRYVRGGRWTDQVADLHGARFIDPPEYPPPPADATPPRRRPQDGWTAPSGPPTPPPASTTAARDENPTDPTPSPPVGEPLWRPLGVDGDEAALLDSPDAIPTSPPTLLRPPRP